MTTQTNAPEAGAPVPSVGTVPGVGAAAKKASAKRPSKPAVTKTAKPKAKAKMPKTSKKPVAKKPTKAKKAVGDRLVPADLTQYKVSKDKPTANGNPSVDSDDRVAQMLRGKSLKDVYALVAKHTANQDDAMSVNQLVAKYKHLNIGMQRMNLGNKLRGVLNAK